MNPLQKTRKLKMIEQKGRCYYCDLPMWDNKAHTLPREKNRAISSPSALQCTAETPARPLRRREQRSR